jgi:hypothetical protein
VSEKAVCAAEAAYIVRRALGPVRAWGKALEEMCRNDAASYLSHRLTPCARMHRQGYPRPIYLLRDVANFIRNVRESTSGLSNPGEIETFEIEFDSTTRCPWQARTATLATY